MLKQTIQYVDYNDQEQTEELYFNISKTEAAEKLLDLLPRMEAWQRSTSGPPRELTTAEAKELLALIKILVDTSYGVRSADGKHFRKSDEILQDFKESAVYDAFLFSLIDDPARAQNFMLGIMPKSLIENDLVQAELQKNATTAELPEQTNELKAVEKEVPAYIRENREPTQKELQGMDANELRAAFQRKANKN